MRDTWGKHKFEKKWKKRTWENNWNKEVIVPLMNFWAENEIKFLTDQFRHNKSFKL